MGSATCGGGKQTRAREVDQPAANGGAVCPALTEEQACNEDPCEVLCKDLEGAEACNAEETCVFAGEKCFDSILSEPFASFDAYKTACGAYFKRDDVDKATACKMCLGKFKKGKGKGKKKDDDSCKLPKEAKKIKCKKI